MFRPTCASLSIRGASLRAASSNPAKRNCTNHRRHLPTVCIVTASFLPTDVLVIPSTHRNTIRARYANARALFLRTARLV
jgi:hypothetical protein